MSIVISLGGFLFLICRRARDVAMTILVRVAPKRSNPTLAARSPAETISLRLFAWCPAAGAAECSRSQGSHWRSMACLRLART